MLRAAHEDIGGLVMSRQLGGADGAGEVDRTRDPDLFGKAPHCEGVRRAAGTADEVEASTGIEELLEAGECLYDILMCLVRQHLADEEPVGTAGLLGNVEVISEDGID
jgi:hypothetical protein